MSNYLCPHCNHIISESDLIKKSDAVLNNPVYKPKPKSNKLFVFTWPSYLGGADTRIAHTLKLWSEFMDVTVIPNTAAKLDQKDWTSYLDSINVKYTMIENIPDKIDGFAISMCNDRFFVDGKAKKMKDKGAYIIWSAEMMWHHQGEIEAVLDETVDCVLYTSEINKKYLSPGYKKRKSPIDSYVVDNYIDPDFFPHKIRHNTNFTVGRLSRADNLKYPENFPLFYESLELKNPKFRIMGWNDYLSNKYSWHKFDSKWEFLKEQQESQLDFLHSLDLFVYPLGHNFIESWGRSTVEAMLTGIPVVVPVGHNFANIVEHGKSGFICNTFQDFKSACQHLQANPNRRRDMGDYAANSCREKLCNKESHVAKWKEIFNVK